MVSSAGDRVQVTGYLTNEQLVEYYRRASIFAFPSLDEGFGMPVLEAMAYGVPVIASNTSALPEVCGEAAFLVDPQSTEQIAEALYRLVKEPDLRESYIARGLARAPQFSWRQQSRKRGKSIASCSADYFSSSTAIFNARRNL